jgi:hypothetical protein
LCGFGVLVWPGGVLPAGFVGAGVGDAGETPGLGDDDADGRGDGCWSADGDGRGSAEADDDGTGATAGGAEDPACPAPVCPSAAGCWPDGAPAA